MVKKTIIFLSIAAVIFMLVGCVKSSGSVSVKPDKKSNDATVEKPYPTLTPESENEKKLVKDIDQIYKEYVKNAEMGNKQSNTNNKIFYNKENHKPRFVGYGLAVLSPKNSSGKYHNVMLISIDGKVMPMSLWEEHSTVNKGDGSMKDSWYDGVASDSDPMLWLQESKPESANEKAAVALVQSWAKKNLDSNFSKVVLSTYLFVWGEENKPPNMIMGVAPNKFAYESVINWGSE